MATLEFMLEVAGLLMQHQEEGLEGPIAQEGKLSMVVVVI